MNKAVGDVARTTAMKSVVAFLIALTVFFANGPVSVALEKDILENTVSLEEILETINKQRYEFLLEETQDEEIEVVKEEVINVPEYEEIQMTLTFYGDNASENGGYEGITARGDKLTHGMVASNAYAFDTQFYTQEGDLLYVADRGGSNFDNYNRLDVFIARNHGESDSQYVKRISNLGVQTVTLYKIK